MMRSHISTRQPSSFDDLIITINQQFAILGAAIQYGCTAGITGNLNNHAETISKEARAKLLSDATFTDNKKLFETVYSEIVLVPSKQFTSEEEIDKYFAHLLSQVSMHNNVLTSYLEVARQLTHLVFILKQFNAHKNFPDSVDEQLRTALFTSVRYLENHPHEVNLQPLAHKWLSFLEQHIELDNGNQILLDDFANTIRTNEAALRALIIQVDNETIKYQADFQDLIRQRKFITNEYAKFQEKMQQVRGKLDLLHGYQDAAGATVSIEQFHQEFSDIEIQTLTTNFNECKTIATHLKSAIRKYYQDRTSFRKNIDEAEAYLKSHFAAISSKLTVSSDEAISRIEKSKLTLVEIFTAKYLEYAGELKHQLNTYASEARGIEKLFPAENLIAECLSSVNYLRDLKALSQANNKLVTACVAEGSYYYTKYFNDVLAKFIALPVRTRWQKVSEQVSSSIELIKDKIQNTFAETNTLVKTKNWLHLYDPHMLVKWGEEHKKIAAAIANYESGLKAIEKDVKSLDTIQADIDKKKNSITLHTNTFTNKVADTCHTNLVDAFYPLAHVEELTSPLNIPESSLEVSNDAKLGAEINNVKTSVISAQKMIASKNSLQIRAGQDESIYVTLARNLESDLAERKKLHPLQDFSSIENKLTRAQEKAAANEFPRARELIESATDAMTAVKNHYRPKTAAMTSPPAVEPSFFSRIGGFFKRNWKPLLIGTALFTAAAVTVATLALTGVISFGIIPAAAAALATTGVSTAVANGIVGSSISAIAIVAGFGCSSMAAGMIESCRDPSSRPATPNSTPPASPRRKSSTGVAFNAMGGVKSRPDHIIGEAELAALGNNVEINAAVKLAQIQEATTNSGFTPAPYSSSITAGP